jgi:alpha-mannosidase
MLLPKVLSRRNFLKGSLALTAFALLMRVFKVARADPPIKRIYIAPDDHTDYFWTAGEDEYRQAFLDMIDYYLDQVDATQGDPADFQGRWSCDGSFWVWTYEKNRTTAQFERLINRIKDRHINFPLNALIVCQGGTPTEAVLRGMYYAGDLERRYDLRVRMAFAIENQTLPYGLPALWSGSGARYSWMGICGCDSQVYSAWDRLYDIYWATGPDGSRILMKWNSMLNGNDRMGGYAEARRPSTEVDYVDGDAGFIARYPYSVIGVFGKGWDDPETQTAEFITTARNKSNASRRVIVSNELDFFEDFEATYGADLPSMGCSFGNEWELYCASLSEVSARVKRSVEKLRGAEALASLVSLEDSAFMTGREAARAQAWMDLGLFWEHDFGMCGPPSGLVNERIAWQKRLASEVESYVNTLQNDAITSLGGMIPKCGTNTCFFAFNPLSWSRSGAADFPYSDTNPVHVLDLSTGLEVPSQIVVVDGQRYLRILAENVPPVGYKVFEIQAGTGQSFSDAATVNGGVLENQSYRITVANRGAITSLIDKGRSNREFVQAINSRSINDLGSGSGTLQVESQGPVSVTLLATSSGPLAHTTRITLFRNSNAIHIRNDITQNFDTVNTWGFGLNLSNPDIWHEEVGVVIRAKLLTQGGHYSDRAGNSRYDWLTLNHFVDVNSGSVGLTLSNADCYFMKLGSSTPSWLDTSTPKISVLAGGRVVNGDNGLPNQGNDTHFLQRFAIRTHAAYDPVSAMQFALEHQNPLITGIVTGGDVYPETCYSLVAISNSNVLLWALKPADSGIDQGIVARLWNLSSASQSFKLSLAKGPLHTAQQLSHIETPLGPTSISDGALNEVLAAQMFKTFSLVPGASSAMPTAANIASPGSTIASSPTPGSTIVPSATPAKTLVPGAPTGSGCRSYLPLIRR